MPDSEATRRVYAAVCNDVFQTLARYVADWGDNYRESARAAGVGAMMAGIRLVHPPEKIADEKLEELATSFIDAIGDEVEGNGR